MSLTILCVTAGEQYAWPFLAEMQKLADDLDTDFVEYDGAYAGSIEAVLDDAIDKCPDGYILRLDDDERCSDAMRDWLHAGEYRKHDHWTFRRAHLYPDADTFVTARPLWPDWQTRLSVKAKAGGRRRLHQPSPFGSGVAAPVVIEHHKFLVRTEDERRELVERYESMQAGAGANFHVFSLPEEYDLETSPYRSIEVAV